MKELNDDMLNKYIDGELDKELMQEIKIELASSSEAMLRYKMLLSVDNGLRKMPAERLSSDFTSNLMLKIQKSLKSKKEQNFFIISILSLFLFISVGIIGYLLANYIFSVEPGSTDIFTQLTEPSESLKTFLKNFFSKGNVSIIGSIFSFILLISGYFFYESLKHSRNH
ncbi:MAG: hypothetical protein EHM47_02115 [Ignavibacteriales bacterium]|nr:MAG: hypothetical protein EHM47_02115 [Ignavibacteriales bacterium]